MRPNRLGALAIASFASFASLGSPARADAPGGVRLEYVAPAGCPDRDHFVAEVFARTARLRLATADEPAATTFRVALVRDGERFDGRVAVEGDGGKASVRHVHGDACAVVASALALVTALAIDPEASTAPLPAPGSALTPAPVPSPPAETAPTPGGDREPPQGGLQSTAGVGAIPTERDRDPHHDGLQSTARVGALSTEGDRTLIGASFTLEAEGLGAPVGLLTGPSALAEVSLPGPRLAGPLRLAPEFRLGLARMQGPLLISGDRTAEFTWVRLEGSVCPLRLAVLEGAIEVRPCANAVLAAIDAVGKVGNTVQTPDNPWAELGMSALVDWGVVGPLGIVAEGGFAAPLVRKTFAFGDPTVNVYTPPPAVAIGRLGLRVRFP